MKIELIKQKFDNEERYKYIPFEFCCEEMRENPLINLFHEHAYNVRDNEDVPYVMLRELEIFTQWGEDWEEETYYKIDYCPFCGEPIEVNVVWEEDVSNAYFNLCKQRDEAWRKYNATDSKSLSSELYKKVHELDNQINWYYNLEEYREV